VPSFLAGAKKVRDYVDKVSIEKNSIFILADHLTQNYPKRSIHVCMPYTTRLRHFGSWFVQLWGESLGKEGKGFTPLAALGATDQHSILQLLRDGPDDKVTFFLTLDQVEDEIQIPKLPDGGPGAPRKIYPSFQLLANHTLHELLQIEYQATATVLAKQNRPQWTLRLDRLDEESLGALLFTFATLTAYTGSLWKIDPFNQPGVEEGKGYIREALSQPQHA
jgi:glucose-6-phosphate isomerase